MADTTTTIAAARILTEKLAAKVLAAAKPKMVVAQFMTQTSIAGYPSPDLKLTQFTDLGPAREVAETADIAATAATSLGYETPVVVTPAENAVEYAVITDKTIEKGWPGMVKAADILQRASADELMRFFAPAAMRLGLMVDEKVESDCVDLLSNFSNTVGSTGVNIDVLTHEEAIFTLNTQELPHGQFVACYTPRQVSDLRREIAITGGGFDGPLRNMDVGHPGDAMNGFQFVLLGVPVFEISNSLVNTANSGADVDGAMFLWGQGDPDQGEGRPGALAYVEGRPLYFEFDRKASARTTQVIINLDYEVAERHDSYGVTVRTDA
jgi:hypothetical protein